MVGKELQSDPASHQRQVKLVTPDGPATRAVTVSAERGWRRMAYRYPLGVKLTPSSSTPLPGT